eukprot:5838863-Pleurochrysis_carterae.AAC.1
MASAALAPAADDSVFTAVSLATVPGGRSRSDFGAVVCAGAASGRTVSGRGAGASLACAPACATSMSRPVASSQLSGG